MSVYSVKTDPNAASPRFNNTDACVVQANSTAEAKALAKATADGDSNGLWAGATVADLATPVALEGWVFQIEVNTDIPVDVSVTGDSNDTLDDVCAKLVTALLVAVGTAIAGTAHSSYNSTTNVLTISTIGDGIGNMTITTTVTPPAGLFQDTYAWSQADVVGSKVDGGIAGAVLTQAFSTSWVVPGRLHPFKQ